MRDISLVKSTAKFAHTHAQAFFYCSKLKREKRFYTIHRDALVEVVIGADRRKVNKPYINFPLLSLFSGGLLFNLPFCLLFHVLFAEDIQHRNRKK